LLPVPGNGPSQLHLHARHVLLSKVQTSQYLFFYPGFLYLFGAIAWYLSALVLRREQQRNLAQSIWIHRLFWILAGTFSVYKMFEDYFLPLNLILNICLIVCSFLPIQRTSSWPSMGSTAPKTAKPF
jgi:hypothetical protein